MEVTAKAKVNRQDKPFFCKAALSHIWNDKWSEWDSANAKNNAMNKLKNFGDEKFF